jgi:hypothetical protein
MDSSLEFADQPTVICGGVLHAFTLLTLRPEVRSETSIYAQQYDGRFPFKRLQPCCGVLVYTEQLCR